MTPSPPDGGGKGAPKSGSESEGPSDEELMALYVRDGDKGAFKAIFGRYSRRLYGLFMRSVGSEATANDMVQQTFLHLHRARNDFRQGAKLRPWLYTIAINVRREHFRRRARKPETCFDPVVHGEPSVGPDASTATDRLVRRALAELVDDQREVILLHWYEDLSFPEIAELVGASVSAVKVRAHRGYVKLRALLSDPL